MKSIRAFIYRRAMRALWNISRKVYYWCEGKRPAGGF